MEFKKVVMITLYVRQQKKQLRKQFQSGDEISMGWAGVAREDFSREGTWIESWKLAKIRKGWGVEIWNSPVGRMGHGEQEEIN